MEDKDNLNIKLKLISLLLIKIDIINLSNIAIILDINNQNLSKNELIKIIIDHLKITNIKN